MALPDIRPVCTCPAYTFPHKLEGGACNGQEFAEHHWLYARKGCEFCNLNSVSYCDAQTGAESIRHGECYKDSEGIGAVDLAVTLIEEASRVEYTGDLYNSELLGEW